jgi:hypothetical protein
MRICVIATPQRAPEIEARPPTTAMLNSTTLSWVGKLP